MGEALAGTSFNAAGVVGAAQGILSSPLGLVLLTCTIGPIAYRKVASLIVGTVRR